MQTKDVSIVITNVNYLLLLINTHSKLIIFTEIVIELFQFDNRDIKIINTKPSAVGLEQAFNLSDTLADNLVLINLFNEWHKVRILYYFSLAFLKG